MLNSLKKGLSIPDEVCTKIFLTLFAENISGIAKMRFNKLHDRLAELGLEMPKSTLSDHLKHLTEVEMVIRKVEDVQKVSYAINMKGIANLKEAIERTIENKKLFDRERKKFFSEPLEDQINDILFSSFYTTLLRLKHWILYKTYGKFEDGILLRFVNSNFFKLKERQVVEKAVKDEEYRKAILQTIESSLKKWVERL
jgi:DNA-binding HxlR family transcriptional regulator